MLDRDHVMPQLLARRAAERPDRVFVTEVGGRRVTHAQLSDEALIWASALARAGVAPGEGVLVMLPSGIDAHAVWLGIGWLRALEVPVNTQYLGTMLQYVVDDSRAEVMVISRRWLDRLIAVGPACTGLRTVVVLDDLPPTLPPLPFEVVGRAEFLLGSEPASHLPEPEPWDIASVLYTSGTTGPSKGVLVPWAQLHATAVGQVPIEDFDDHDVAYVPFPSYHVSAKGPLYLMLLCDGAAVVREQFSTEEFLHDVAEHGCTYGMLIFAMARFLHDQPPRPEDAATPLEKVVMVPPIPEVHDFARRFGVRVGTLYNMTEISVPLVTWDIEDPASCGRVRDGYELRVVDEHDREVPLGEVGELLVRSDEPWTLNAGYFGMPEATARAWRNGWFHTGDGFRRDAAGNHYFVDRFKDTIRRRGENVSSTEVEAIVATHPGVAECAAVAVPSEHGEDEVKVVVVPAGEEGLDPAELIGYLEPRMPRFMVPRYVEVVDELPKTPTAKVRKVELRAAGVTERTWDRTLAGARPAPTPSEAP